jgi:hypothetical protein
VAAECNVADVFHLVLRHVLTYCVERSCEPKVICHLSLVIGRSERLQLLPVRRRG